MVNCYLQKSIVLIPSLDPDEELLKYVKGLKKEGFTNIVIVDDGSCDECRWIFDALGELDGVEILRHAVNQGKGRALKTGFHYILNTSKYEEIVGVVTADADGQHSVSDTGKVAKKLCDTDNFILGKRNFDLKQVPFKSRLGNKITTLIFWLLYSKNISDTQTGLRGIPYEYIKQCLTLEGERFEYEILMLIDAVKSGQIIDEEDIETIYINSNRATHFRAIRDSVKIYKLLIGTFLKFALSGIASFIIDIAIFVLFTKVILTGMDVSVQIYIGTFIARVISSLFNYAINRNAVFANNGKVIWSIIKYYTLCIFQMICSGVLVVLLFDKLMFDTTLLKCFVDVILFFVSYQIQRLWVFKEKSCR